MNARIRLPRLDTLLPGFLALLAFGTTVQAQGDPAVVESLLYEGKESSQVWETLITLSEEHGPRLTGSAALQEANEWTRDKFIELGLEAHLQEWGTIPVRFDRGPSHARMLEPVERELEFTSPSWSRGTDGPLRARVVKRPQTLEEAEGLGWDLEGAWVLCPSRPRGRRRQQETAEAIAAREESEAIDAALDEIGIAGRLTSSSNELVLTSSVRGWRKLTMDTIRPGLDVRIRLSDYEAIAAQLDAGEAVTVEVNMEHHFVEGPFPVYNTVAEIRGSELPDEVVIFSGHLDSWDGPGSLGTQDNGTGCSVMLEAARILMASGVKPKRTIRFILWSGEEQGLLGSRGYVESLSEEERAGISACFVDDGGTNYQGGVLCIQSQLDMLDTAMEPVRDAFPELPIENTVLEKMSRFGGSDHASFNQVGIPGYFFKESGSGGREGKDYNFVHHTQHDHMRYAVPEYLVQAATCTAVVAYQLAEAETLLPREIPGEDVAAEEADDPTFVVTEGALSGDWNVSFVGDEAPDVGFVVSLEMATDGRLRGSMTGITGTSKIREGRWDAQSKKATFAAVTDFGKLDFSASIEGSVLRGMIDVMGNEMEFRGERKPADSPLAGKWLGLITEMDSEFTLVIEPAAGGALAGRFKSSQSDSKLYDLSWDNEEQTLTFEYDYPHAGRLPVTAKLVEGELVGTIGENADFVAKRASTD